MHKFQPKISNVIDNAVELSRYEKIIDEDQKIVIYHPNLNYLGDDFVSKYNCFKLPIQWDKFPDQTPNIQYYPCIKNQDIIFLLDTYNLNDFMPQLMLLYALPQNDINH